VSLPSATAVTQLLKNEKAACTFRKYDCRWFNDVEADDATTTTFVFDELPSRHLESQQQLSAEVYKQQLVAAGLPEDAIKPGSLMRQFKILDTGIKMYGKQWEFKVLNSYLDNLGSTAEDPVPFYHNGKQIPRPRDAIMFPPQAFMILDSLDQLHHRSISIKKGCQRCWGPHHTKCLYYKWCKTCLEYLPTLGEKGFKHCCSMGVEGMKKTEMIRIQKPEKPKVVIPLDEAQELIKAQHQRAIQARLLRLQEKRAANKQRNQEQKDAREASGAKRAKPTVSELIILLTCFCSLARTRWSSKTPRGHKSNQEQTKDKTKNKDLLTDTIIDNKIPATRIKLNKIKKIYKIKIKKYG
jgi:hypothetical protein